MAEIETYHTQKVEDFALLAKEHLDGEIEFYEQVSSKEKSLFSPPRPA
jgi:sorting nexin-9/18/33